MGRDEGWGKCLREGTASRRRETAAGSWLPRSIFRHCLLTIFDFLFPGWHVEVLEWSPQPNKYLFFYPRVTNHSPTESQADTQSLNILEQNPPRTRAGVRERGPILMISEALWDMGYL